MSFALVRTVVGAAVLAVASFSAQASLIVNGDFEANPVNPNSWTWMPSSQVPGWQGSNIEIWNSMNGVQAVTGNHFIELNAHGSNQGAWSIFQSFETLVGQSYELSFYYRARNGSNEQFEVTVADVSQTLNDHTNKSWNFFSSSFVATDTNTTLRFTSHNSGTMGNFIDGVNVVAQQGTAAVPAPATWGVMALGLVLLGATRRMRSR
ncbi:DUF642 domain-containing protein [Alkalimonas sp.]|uniref:DUF642 domain-containing protein n=1 Tax=Alkalimonas sp. TaxID=1872453 RepID=UPI00263A7C84|nr:DUF642 domain-containing protein [Alkalimonas sp.]MCC5827455.1 DUF642 domain-containing protein [Alkalimonas sp.]